MRVPRLLLAGIVSLFLPGLAFGQATTSTQTFDVPISLSVFVPCAAGGAGEVVDISGPLHVTISVTVNRNEGAFTENLNPQDIVGTGETTGDTYHATGNTQVTANASLIKFPLEFSFVDNFDLIGTTSTAGTLIIHETVHVTINANGTFTANFDKPFVTCQ